MITYTNCLVSVDLSQFSPVVINDDVGRGLKEDGLDVSEFGDLEGER